MSRLKLFVSSTALFLTPVLFVSAQVGTGLVGGKINDNALSNLLRNILAFTETILVPFILGIGFLVFVWGMFQYFILGGANDEAKEKGKSLIFYALAGFVLILVFWGLVNILANFTGGTGESLQTVPTSGISI